MKSFLRIVLVLTLLAPFSTSAAILASGPPDSSNPPSSSVPFAPKGAQPLATPSDSAGGAGAQTTQASATQYEWAGQFHVSSSQAGGQPSTVLLSNGPFSSQQACYSDAASYPQSKYPGKTVTLAQPPGYTCTCESPLSAQLSCPHYTAPTSNQPARTPATITPSTQTQTSAPQQTTPSSAFVPLAPIPGLTEGVVANSHGLANFLNNLYKYLIGVAAVLAVIMIIWGGLEIATQDSVSKQGAGRKKIQDALYGLVLVLSPALVFGIINPSILDLNFAKSLKPLDIHNTTVTHSAENGDLGGSGTGGTTITGCSAESGNKEFQAVNCSTSDAAAKWSDANCGGEAVIPTSCTSGQYNNGSCTSGYQAYCLGVSQQPIKFVQIGEAKNFISSLISSQSEMRPIDSDKAAADAFIAGCSTKNVCILQGASVGSCDDTFVHSFNTSVQTPFCETGQLLCTINNIKCESTTLVCDSPGSSCPDYR